MLGNELVNHFGLLIHVHHDRVDVLSDDSEALAILRRVAGDGKLHRRLLGIIVGKRVGNHSGAEQENFLLRLPMLFHHVSFVVGPPEKFQGGEFQEKTHSRKICNHFNAFVSEAGRKEGRNDGCRVDKQ